MLYYAYNSMYYAMLYCSISVVCNIILYCTSIYFTSLHFTIHTYYQG